MRACFVDNAEPPIQCAHDIDEVHNCRLATDGVKKRDCEYWEPGRAIKLALDILGVPNGVSCGRCPASETRLRTALELIANPDVTPEMAARSYDGVSMDRIYEDIAKEALELESV